MPCVRAWKFVCEDCYDQNSNDCGLFALLFGFHALGLGPGLGLSLLILSNHLTRPLPQHAARAVRIPAHDLRHDARVDNP